MIESLALDVEDVRLALARGFFFPTEHSGVPCLSTILDFVEQGNYPPTWKDPEVFDDAERMRKEKEFGICKAALVKAVVEIAGEEKNADILWDDSESLKPGGPFVYRMVSWIKSYVEEAGSGEVVRGLRDDLAIAASLSLGNLSRRRECFRQFSCSLYSNDHTRILFSCPTFSTLLACTITRIAIVFIPGHRSQVEARYTGVLEECCPVRQPFTGHS